MRQIRAAREMLGWSQLKLAAHAGIGWQTVLRGERRGEISQQTVGRLVHILESQGIEFFTTGRRESVTLVGPLLGLRDEDKGVPSPRT